MEVDIKVSDVHRNEQVNIIALREGLQTILCSDLTHGTYYALWPMKGDSQKFVLSSEGEDYQSNSRAKYGGKDLPLFRKIFAAEVYAPSNLRNNTIEFWEDMKSAGLFKYWDPEEGPYKYYEEAAHNEVQMLRVYKVDRDLNPHNPPYILPNVGFRNYPKWIGGSVPCKGMPVLSDQYMEEQRTEFDQILQKHGNPPTTRPRR